MAFSIRNLSVLAYANGFTLWHYKSSTDTLDHITGPGYFSGADDMLSAADLMMVSASDGAAIRSVRASDNGGAALFPIS